MSERQCQDSRVIIILIAQVALVCLCFLVWIVFLGERTGGRTHDLHNFFHSTDGVGVVPHLSATPDWLNSSVLQASTCVYDRGNDLR